MSEITMSEGFRIENDQQAEWALAKIAEARAEQAKWTEFYTAKMQAVCDAEENTINYMTALLRRYFDSQEHRVTKTGIRKYSLPSAELILKPGGIDYKRDDEALLAWCDANLPRAVKVTRKPGWSDVKTYIKETGEIPDGVEVYETEPTFQVKEVQ